MALSSFDIFRATALSEVVANFPIAAVGATAAKGRFVMIVLKNSVSDRERSNSENFFPR